MGEANQRLMEDNCVLIEDIKELRKRIRTINLEPLTQTGAARAANGQAAASREAMASAEQVRLLQEQMADLEHLRAAIQQREAEWEASKPVSRERLPPME